MNLKRRQRCEDKKDPSQVPDLGGCSPVVVIASVVVGDRGVHQFIYIHVIQAGEANGVELSAEIRRFSPCE